ncbi:hypothetical protein BS50DRAFT_374182 [Corynespora cassiicola Philippines]|uniref:Uncharacterized protein n=1 Tax=Corynespora cassiicola Philippines TaxID=1448308 RepID=A0A2T2NP10_CORCC|nr:hypothetical protein BS50DRAFT_374182 [Corynespora cassiicola Philippines]
MHLGRHILHTEKTASRLHKSPRHMPNNCRYIPLIHSSIPIAPCSPACPQHRKKKKSSRRRRRQRHARSCIYISFPPLSLSLSLPRYQMMVMMMIEKKKQPKRLGQYLIAQPHTHIHRYIRLNPQILKLRPPKHHSSERQRDACRTKKTKTKQNKKGCGLRWKHARRNARTLPGTWEKE